MSAAIPAVPIQVLDHGYVKYIAHLGSDESIIEAARMSTGKGFIGWEDNAQCENCKRVVINTKYQGMCPGNTEGLHAWKDRKGDMHLLEFLYRNKHMTPFEMCELVVEVKAPIEVFRQLHRHRTFSINELSARYTQMPNEHYVPSLERFMPRSGMNRQANSLHTNLTMTETVAKDLQAQSEAAQEELYREYEFMLGAGVPKEVARLNTPVSRYSVMRWKANLRNWIQMFTLRDHPHAQWECQQTVKPIVDITRVLFPRTIALWEEHTKHAVTLSRKEVELLNSMLALNGEAWTNEAKELWSKLKGTAA